LQHFSWSPWYFSSSWTFVLNKINFINAYIISF
jgi:hypothetical protein